MPRYTLPPVSIVVGLDGDDTLWHNERIFSMTEERFETLVGPYVTGADEVRSVLLRVERANLGLLGYGVKSFTLSMIETAIEVSGGAVPTSVIGEIVAAGKAMLDHPVELLEGVLDTVRALAERWRLILVTKGDLFHQESKLARSGLLPYLSQVEIVSEKEPATYERILSASGVAAADFVMVGDSLRSDIESVLAVGGRAIHIPGFREWELEAATLDPSWDGRWWRLHSITEVPPLLSTLG
jgi:putative hydrolase of the HAD superfamily